MLEIVEHFDIVRASDGHLFHRLGGHFERASAAADRRSGRRLAERLVPDDGVGHSRLRRHDRLDVVARHELDVVHGEHVGRVDHRDRQGRAGSAEGNDLVLLSRFRRDQLDDRRVDVEQREIDRGDPVLLAEQRGDLLVFDEAELDEIETELAAVGLLVGQRLLQLSRSDALLFEQQLTNADGHCSRFSLK